MVDVGKIIGGVVLIVIASILILAGLSYVIFFSVLDGVQFYNIVISLIFIVPGVMLGLKGKNIFSDVKNEAYFEEREKMRREKEEEDRKLNELKQRADAGDPDTETKDDNIPSTVAVSSLQEEQNKLESQVLSYCNPQEIACEILNDLEKASPMPSSWTTPMGYSSEIGSLFTSYELWFIRKPDKRDNEDRGLIRGPLSNCDDKMRFSQIVLDLVKKCIADDMIKLDLDAVEDAYTSTMYIYATISKANVEKIKRMTPAERAEKRANVGDPDAGTKDDNISSTVEVSSTEKSLTEWEQISKIGESGEYSNRGRAFAKEGDYDRAIVEYTKALTVNPRFFSMYVLRGNAYSRKGDYDLAISDYNKAIEINPEKATVYNQRGFAYSNKGDFDNAIADYNRSLKIEPTFSTYIYRAEEYEKKGDYDSAITDYNKALELNPDDDGAYFYLGNAYVEVGNFDKAIENYTKFIALKPDEANGYFQRGIAYDKKGDYDNVIIDFTRYISMNADDIDGYNKRGCAYSVKGEHDKAIADFTEVLRLNPNSAIMYYNRGFEYLVKKDNDRAILDFTQYIKLEPNDADGYYQRGLMYYAKGDNDKAITDFKATLRINPVYKVNPVYGDANKLLEKAR